MDWDDATDVVIAGAGGAGLAAALTAAVHGASVLVLEKHAKIGGTTSVSGGIVWVPGNRQMTAAGKADSPDAARAYFQSLDPTGLREDVLMAFIDHGADAIAFLEDQSRLSFTMLANYPDYYLDRPGARPDGGRALDSGLFAYSELGEWRARIADNGAPYPVTVAETPLGGGSGQIAPEEMGRRIATDTRGFGQSLLAALLEACLAKGVRIETNAGVDEVIKQDGRAVGVRVGTRRIYARRGVVLATGGFEHNGELTQTFLRGPIAYPASPPTNQGDGLKLAMNAGAALGNMTSAWWCPTIQPTGEVWFDHVGGGPHPKAYPILIERTMPGSIIINRQGKRFCNEATNYSALAGAFHQFDPATYSYQNMPAWLVFDHAYKCANMIASLPPGPERPAWITCGETPEALGAALGVPGAELATTIKRFNGLAAAGVDLDFGRGQSPYDRFYGDRSKPGALATLAPLSEPPYYAAPLHLGVLGTNGGAKTDAHGRILDHQGQTIAGLYAVGNCMAGATGSVYAGAGGTLGPALTFGYLAGRHAAIGGN
jgi:3-oxosteroid 1-dehydrogenase